MVHSAVADGILPDTFCTDDGAGLLYRGTAIGAEAVTELGSAKLLSGSRKWATTVLEERAGHPSTLTAYNHLPPHRRPHLSTAARTVHRPIQAGVATSPALVSLTCARAPDAHTPSILKGQSMMNKIVAAAVVSGTALACGVLPAMSAAAAVAPTPIPVQTVPTAPARAGHLDPARTQPPDAEPPPCARQPPEGQARQGQGEDGHRQGRPGQAGDAQADRPESQSCTSRWWVRRPPVRGCRQQRPGSLVVGLPPKLRGRSRSAGTTPVFRVLGHRGGAPVGADRTALREPSRHDGP